MECGRLNGFVVSLILVLSCGRLFAYSPPAWLSNITELHYKDFYIEPPSIKAGAGPAPGVRYWKPLLFNASLQLNASVRYSFLGYLASEIDIGKFTPSDLKLVREPVATGLVVEYGYTRQEKIRVSLYATIKNDYYPRETFYGSGPETVRNNRSDFQLKRFTAEGVLHDHFSPHITAEFTGGLVQIDTGPGKNDAITNTQDLFDDNQAQGINNQPDFFHASATMLLDFRDDPANTHSGNLLGFQIARFDDISEGQYAFNRFAVDARHYQSLVAKEHVIAGRFLVSMDAAAKGNRVPFFFQETLGGSTTLRGYRDYRFRDTKLLYFSAEYRWEIAPFLESAVFTDFGKVFSSVSDFNLQDLKSTVGFGVRLKTKQGMLLRIDAGHSEEENRIYFRIIPAF